MSVHNAGIYPLRPWLPANLSELPAILCPVSSGLDQRFNFSSPCDLLDTTIAPSSGISTAIGRQTLSFSRSSAVPEPQARLYRCGRRHYPITGTPSSIRAMLTVNSPLRRRNSLVPSIGSTSQNVRPMTFFKTLRDRLFADCWNTGQQVAEGWHERFGALVGFRHRRSIVLVPDFEIRRIHIEIVARTIRYFGRGFHQVVKVSVGKTKDPYLSSVTP